MNRPLADREWIEPTSARVRILPIGPEDVPEVGEFLHRNLNGRISAEDWAASIIPPWSGEAPNHGFLLIADGNLVGVHLAFYSVRRIGGRVHRLCNLAAFCVLDEYRCHSIRLIKALLAQPGYSFTDLSPSRHVVPLNERLGFRQVDTATALAANLPWPIVDRGVRMLTHADEISRSLSGRDLDIYRAHAQAKASHHVVISRGEDTCYILFRHDRRKRLPVFASLLHVGNQELFRQTAPYLFRHLLLRHRILGTLVELRVAGFRPPRSFMLAKPRPKMFRSNMLAENEVDYVFSELTCVAW